jgi:hypothetical protein
VTVIELETVKEWLLEDPEEILPSLSSFTEPRTSRTMLVGLRLKARGTTKACE